MSFTTSKKFAEENEGTAWVRKRSDDGNTKL
jgi:hypothetical protein